MSKWSWVETLSRSEIEDHLNGIGEAIAKAEASIRELQETKTKLQFRLNALRRQAGEI